jgi:hypothetical protein
MEGMDADCYLVEYMIRDRLGNARARAQAAALLLQANNSQPPKRIETRFTDLGRELVNTVRKAAVEIFQALPGRARVAKHS